MYFLNCLNKKEIDILKEQLHHQNIMNLLLSMSINNHKKKFIFHQQKKFILIEKLIQKILL